MTNNFQHAGAASGEEPSWHGRYANLVSDVVHVRGALRSALYDLRRQQIFSLNELDTQAASCLFQGETIEEVMARLPNTNSLLQFLLERDMITVDRFPEDRNTSLLDDVPEVTFSTCWLELSTSCNHTCVHCYNLSGPQSRPALDLLAIESTLRQLINIGSETLKILGGEPLVHRSELPQLFAISRELGFKSVAVHTNGTLVNTSWIDHFVRWNIQVDITVYGHTAELHEAVTATPGSFRATLGALDLLEHADLCGTINLIILPHNESHLPSIKRYFQLHYPKLPFAYDYLRPSGRGLPLYRQLSFEYLNRYQEHRDGFPGLDRQTFRERHHYNPCLKDKILIAANGDVMPCIMTREVAGNLGRQALRTIVRGSSFRRFRELPMRHLHVCRDCEYRYACDDCRPLALGVTGDLFSKPPECRYNPYTGKLEEPSTRGGRDGKS